MATMMAAEGSIVHVVGGDEMMMEGVGGVGDVIANWRASFAKFISEEEDKDESRTFNNRPTRTNPKCWSET